MKQTLSLKIEASLEQLKKIRQELSSFFEQWKANENDVFTLLLMVDEIVTNIIRYGYENKKGEISLDVHYTDHTAEITIEDSAPPFNPLEYPPVDIEKHLNEGKTHGLGIHVLRTYADSCEYQKTKNGNRLIIRKVMH
jgi:serine/threonine-protein kinase RsbW